jgi:hypothetical protein
MIDKESIQVLIGSILILLTMMMRTLDISPIIVAFINLLQKTPCVSGEMNAKLY